MSEEQKTLLRLGRTACVVYHDAFSDYPAQIDAMGMWERVALAVATEVLTDPEGYAHALGLPEPHHFYVCNGCGRQHPKGEPCPDAHLLNTAAQRLGWLLFQAGKTASGTALEQYCALGMVAARELLADPAGWARALGLPDPPRLPEWAAYLVATGCAVLDVAVHGYVRAATDHDA